MSIDKRILYGGSAILFGILSTPSFGETAAVDGDRRGSVDVRDEHEIIVTAEKREQSLQKVPSSITAFTAGRRDEVGISTLQDVANLTPGMSISPGPAVGDQNINIRGIGKLVSTLGNDNGVAVYADGFYTPRAIDLSRNTAYIARTEILRGPQGTLYGRNSIGGAVNVISPRPTKDWTGHFRGEVGNYDLANVTGAISGPITKSLGVRVVASRLTQGRGYFHNVSNGSTEGGNGKSYVIDGQLEWNPVSNLDLWARFTREKGHIRLRSTVDQTPYDGTQLALAQVNPLGWGYAESNPAITDVRAFRGDTATEHHYAETRGIVRARYDADAFSVTYIGGYSRYHARGVSDVDATERKGFYYLPVVSLLTGAAVPAGTPGALFVSTDMIGIGEQNFKYYSNEVNIASSRGVPLQWIVGAYQYHEKSSMPLTTPQLNQPEALTPCTFDFTTFSCTGSAAPNPNGSLFDLESKQRTNSYAVFGQADWDVSSKLHVTLGLRHTWDRKAGLEGLRIASYNPYNNDLINLLFGSGIPSNAAIDYTQAYFGATPGVTINPVTGLAERRVKGHWAGLSGTAGLEWHPTERAIYYFKYSRGYKSGGFNLGGLVPGAGPEHANAYELGLKQDFGRLLRINAAGFYYDYRGLQTTITACLDLACTLTRKSFVNLTRARTLGAEFEIALRPTRDFTVLANYSYIDAKIGKQKTTFLNTVTNAQEDIEGNRIPNTTPNKVSLTGIYDIHLGNGDTLTLSGTYVWRDKTSYSVFRAPSSLEAKAYDQVDFRALLSIGNRFRLIGYVRNAFDTKGFNNADTGPAPGFAPKFSLTPPRTYGAEVQVDF